MLVIMMSERMLRQGLHVERCYDKCWRPIKFCVAMEGSETTAQELLVPVSTRIIIGIEKANVVCSVSTI